jgi:hypothetical protein
MALDQELKDLMITSGSFQNVTSRDVYGKRTGGAVVPFKCHLTFIRNENYSAEDIPADVPTGQIIMDGVYNIEKGAIITVNGQQVKAVRVITYFDEKEANHTTVEFA